MRTTKMNSGNDLSVALPIKINGESVSALIDSGAGPSVIDFQSICDLGLKTQVICKTDKIFGLAREPVGVVGTLDLTLDLGNGQIIEHPFEVLENIHTTCILGRDLLSKFGVTEFNWKDHQIRIGDV